MTREERRDQLLAFLETIRRPGTELAGLGDQDHLVRFGLIDSLALLEIIAFLEEEWGVDFATTGVDPGQLTTVATILDLVERPAA